MDESEQTINTTAFLFGNINSKGQLEADDEELVCLNKLSHCNLEEINNTIQSLFSQPDTVNDNLSVVFTDKVNSDNINSIDYYDENECIEDFEFNAMVDTHKMEKSYNDEVIFIRVYSILL